MKNLKFKITVSVYVCLLFLAVYSLFLSYLTNISQEKQIVFAKLSTISTLLAKQIDGEIYEKIVLKYKDIDDIKTSNQDQNYQNIHEILAEAKSSTNLNTPIYTLFPSENGKKFFFGITSSKKPYYKHLYHTPPEDLISEYETGGLLDEYNDENEIWLSSFSPIKNKAGKVVGIVLVNLNFKEFIINVDRKLIGNIAFIILIYSVIGFLLYLFLKEVLEKEEIFLFNQKKYNEDLELQVSKRTNELNVSNIKLFEVNKELESFFYSTSHDIRGPLCRILGLTSLAIIEDDKQSLIEMIDIESRKMDTILKKMIFVNNLRTKIIKIETVSINDKLNATVSSNQKKYHLKKLELIINIETQTLKKFNSDTQIIDAILENLIDNAFKFCDSNSPKIVIDCIIDINNILCLSVANNGSKFSDEEIKHAFELFKNASNYGDIKDGIRLGLYTVKTAIKKLNGSVQIETDCNDLTQIKVLIPDYYIIDEIKETLELAEKIN